MEGDVEKREEREEREKGEEGRGMCDILATAAKVIRVIILVEGQKLFGHSRGSAPSRCLAESLGPYSGSPRLELK
jgi:hypothetical protein